jgi:predicted Zn-dependent protease
MFFKNFYPVHHVVKPVAALAIVLSVAGCTTSPTSGRPIFTGLVSQSQENAIGQEQHGSILKQYNGVNDNERLNEFVAMIGTRLVPQAERKDVTWRFTVLDDDMVNAFAVPGGYIYITRGLLNLAQDESQVAAVLAHEMGHINARHTAQQMSQGMVANLGLSAVGIALGSNVASQAGSVGADLYLKKYSRDHEFEADALSVKYLTGAGYDPYAATKFLAMLQEHTNLERRMAGSAAEDEMFSYFSTHPQTPERVARARALADQAPHYKDVTVDRADYLKAVDGTVYGDSAKQGFIRGNRFIHPELGIAFDAPAGFKLKNTPQQVVADNGNGSLMIFDMAAGQSTDPSVYITSVWAPGAPLSQQQKITVNGMDAATAATQISTSQGAKDARLVALSAGDGKFYRLVFATPQGGMSQYERSFLNATHTFHQLSGSERQQASPNRVRLITVKNGDTIQSLAAKMPVADYAVERFCLLNGLAPTDALRPGDTVKTVAAF